MGAKCVSLSKIAAETGFSARHWCGMAAKGKLPGAIQPAGPRGGWRVDLIEFRKWLEAGKPKVWRASTSEASRGKAAARRAGIPDLRWHDLRRTCGCRLLQDHGLSIEKVSKWLGHQSIAVTERAYAFLNVEHLHKAIEHAPALERPVIEGEAEEISDSATQS